MAESLPTDAAASMVSSQGRWRLAATILVIACVAQGLFWYRYREDPTHSKMSVLFVWPAALFALFVWWTFFSGFRWKTRLTVLAVLTAGWMSFFAVYRIDGSDGDMLPRLSYRWNPTPEARSREFWKQQQVSSAAAAPAEELPELAAGPDDWPDYRGSQRDGIVRGNGFRKDWDARPPKELWRHPVGLGWSSFAVLGDYAITQEQRDDDECVVCYSLETGELLWIHKDRARFRAVAVNGGDGPHCTPVIAGSRVYALGGTGLLNCLDTRTGAPVWQTNILADAGTPGQPAANIEWGVSGSPLVTDDLVIAIAGGTAGRSVIAYDRESGKIRWAQGTFPASYAGPRLERFLDTPQLLAFHGTGISGLAVESGEILWEFPWENAPKVNSAQPIRIDERSLLIGCGYGVGAARLELSLAGRWTVNKVWESNLFKLKFNDAVLRDGYAYGLDDGILTCLDVNNGKRKWKGGRYGYGQMLLHEDTLLVLAEEGDLVLVSAAPDRFRELHRIPALSGTTWNHPVVAHGKLLVRNGTLAACFDVAP